MDNRKILAVKLIWAGMICCFLLDGKGIKGYAATADWKIPVRSKLVSQPARPKIEIWLTP
jgi:hypothetical protein